MPTRVSPAQIACLHFNLQKTKMQIGVQLLVHIEKLLKAGAKYFVEAGAIAVRRFTKKVCVMFLKQLTKSNLAVSSLLRGANDYKLDAIERALHDALCIVKRTLESNVVVARGAVEFALSVYLEYLATTMGSREQWAVAEFAEALLIIPKGTTRNNLEAGIIEPAMSKVKIIQFATEAAITILQIDDMIKLVKDDQGED
ncbi:hypothetical protein MKX03_011451 [Papaver bracteatum]|nr:hypothetical protein MKX03_011451 [Papaver bracteatum]